MTIDVVTTMEPVDCAKCGMVFMLPAERMRRLRDTGESFSCPSGHSNVFRPSEADKLRRRVEQLERELKWAKDRADGASKRFNCLYAGCHHITYTKQSARKHLAEAHGFVEKRLKALPANAGPST